MWQRIISMVAILSLSPALALAEESAPKFKPALVYLYSKADSDSAFLDSARAGKEKAQRDFGVPIIEQRSTSEADVQRDIRKLAEDGYNPIIALGHQNATAVLNLAEYYPETRFTVVDGLVPPIYVNVQSVLFRDNEGAFLVGIIAARMAHSDRIGFVGGMDIPLIRNFAVGYAQGAKYANPKVEITNAMLGTTQAAWSTPAKAHTLAMAQYTEGVDVIFSAAGGSSFGVLKAADETGKLAIGVDTNQNSLFPGRVCTSLVKRVDIAVYDALKNAKENSWAPGIKYLGIKEGALDYSVDQNNRALFSEKLIDEVSLAKERIINGIITVDSYSAK